MDRQTNKQTDDLITRCPQRTFQAGGIKRFFRLCCRRRHNVLQTQLVCVCIGKLNENWSHVNIVKNEYIANFLYFTAPK